MDGSARTNNLIAAERRRKVYELALQQGSVNVTRLADALGVTPATIRRDLDVLDEEGKLVRSHGGATIKENGTVRPPYSQMRDCNFAEKALIGEASLTYLPTSGAVFMTGGTTTYQMAIRFPEDRKIHVVTTSPEIGLHLVSNTAASVRLLGGILRPDSLSTNCVADESLDRLYWDVTFVSVPSVDIKRGITTIDEDGAMCMRRIIDHGNKLVLLCDSSKLGCYSHARVAPVTAADVLITDDGADEGFIGELTELGVDVMVVGPRGVEYRQAADPGGTE